MWRDSEWTFSDISVMNEVSHGQTEISSEWKIEEEISANKDL